MCTYDINAMTWKEYAEPVTITITTRKPDKWLFVDSETGEVWRWAMPSESWQTDRPKFMLVST